MHEAAEKPVSVRQQADSAEPVFAGLAVGRQRRFRRRGADGEVDEGSPAEESVFGPATNNFLFLSEVLWVIIENIKHL